MKKLCATLQKINGIIAVVCYGLLVLYAFGMATPCAVLDQSPVSSDFYQQIQPYNDEIAFLALAGVLLALFYIVLRNNVRKVYYVSNFVWNGLYSVYAIITAIQCFPIIRYYQVLYSGLDFATINQYFIDHNLVGVQIASNPPVFVLGYIVTTLVLLSALPSLFVGLYKAYERFGKKQPLPAEGKEAIQ